MVFSEPLTPPPPPSTKVGEGITAPKAELAALIIKPEEPVSNGGENESKHTSPKSGKKTEEVTPHMEFGF